MRKWIIAGVVVVAVAAAGVFALSGHDDYQVKVLMPAADGTYQGAKVVVAGRQVGEITGIDVKDAKAVITATVDGSDAPLHAGTTARISWESVLGGRVLELLPGPKQNAPLPSGNLIDSGVERVELDDLLATLDQPTRVQVQALVNQLSQTLRGRENDVNATVKTAGPAVDALGEVLRAVGEDGPAIKDLVQRLAAMTGELTAHDSDLSGTVRSLGQVTSTAADRQQQLTQALAELPSTVRAADDTLAKVPGAVDATTPLLKDLRPSTSQLPAVAANLSPLLRDLQPTLADLGPTLASARGLLQYTPGLLDSAHATLPGADQAVVALQPAVAFLRPYTPELAGWLSNWTSVFASQSSGNYGRALMVQSASSFNANPGILPPGMKQDPAPAPGSIAGQPWVDANGDGIR